MPENTEQKRQKEFTDEEKREIEAQIRENNPEYAGILDQMGEIKEELRVVDKRRFSDGSTGDGEGTWERWAAEHASEQVEESVDLFLAGKSQFSPSSDPNKPVGMDFSSAIKQVLEGKRVTRLEWNNPEIYLLMFMWGNISPKQPAGKYLSIHHADGSVNPLLISDGDMLGDDWIVVV